MNCQYPLNKNLVEYANAVIYIFDIYNFDISVSINVLGM